MSAIVFAGGKQEVVCIDTDDQGQEKSRLALPRVKNAEELRTALAQYTAWLFGNHLVIHDTTPAVVSTEIESEPQDDADPDRSSLDRAGAGSSLEPGQV